MKKNPLAAPHSTSLRRRSGTLTATLLIAVLLLVWGSGLYAFRVIARSKEKELELRLEAVGRLAVAHLAQEVNFDLLALAIPDGLDDRDDEQADLAAVDFLNLYEQTLEQALLQIVEQTQLRRALVLDIHRRAISDSAGSAAPFLPYEYLDIDRYEINRALEEDRTIATPYYSFQEEPYKRAYTPLKTSGGRIIGFLQLEASRGYFAEMARLRPQLLSLMTIITVLVLLVGWLFHRLLQYTLQAEAISAQADRLRALGTLAAGFAHEVRNPLGIIRSYAEGMADEFGQDKQDLAQMSREMVEEVMRVDALIGQFLNFARPDGSQRTAFQAGQVLESVVRLIRKDLESKNLTVRLAIDENLPPVWGDEKALRQVFLNVILNARDASEPGSSIAIAANARKDRLIVRIEDQGRGIPAADLEHVFDPFFTTKSGGTGLGLAISRNIIEQFGGEILIRSQPGRGTEVDLVLPLKRQ